MNDATRGAETIVANLVRLLTNMPLRAAQRKALIAQFQAVVWEGLPTEVDPEVRDVLGTLAYDLDFYEPQASPEDRRVGYWGDERLAEELADAFERLRELGVDVPAGPSTND